MKGDILSKNNNKRKTEYSCGSIVLLVSLHALNFSTTLMIQVINIYLNANLLPLYIKCKCLANSVDPNGRTLQPIRTRKSFKEWLQRR